MNLVSVIIPYFKKKKFFKKTLESVLNQSYKNFEILIIYDDEDLSEFKFLKKILKKKSKKKIKILINKKNMGAGFSRNKGIKVSKGKYLAFIDADDLWKKNKLKNQINFMKKNNFNFSHTSYNIIDEKEKIIGNFKVKKTLTFEDLIKSCDIGLSTVIVEKKLLKKYKFNKFKTKEDYSLWLKLLKSGVKINGLNKSLTNWRKTNNSLSGSVIQKIIDGFKVYYVSENMNFLASLFFVFRLSLYAVKKKIINYFK